MTEQPLVSVVLPCYNHKQYVGQAIESVLNQTYRNIQLIVCDNGSTDGSYEVISRYSDRIARIFRLEENSILYCSEKIIMAATGEYIAFMTSDDYWEPDKLELQVLALQEHPKAAVSAAWTVYVDDNLRPFQEGESYGPFKTEIFKVENKSRYEWFKDLLYNGNCLAWPSAVYRTDIYKELWYQWRGHRQLSDYYTWLCTVQKYDLYVVPKVLVKYRWHPSGENRNESAVSGAVSVRHMNEYMDVIYRIMEDVEDGFFLKAFEGELCLPEATSHEEVLCEKFFVLKRLAEISTAMGAVIETSAMLFFCNHFMEMRNVIHETYHYTYADYHDWAGERGVGAASVKMSAAMELRRLKDSKRLWQLRDMLLEAAQTDEEYCKVIKMLFSILEPDKQELIRVLDECMKKALELMREFHQNSTAEVYRNGILLAEGLIRMVDIVREELEFLCIELKEEDWHAYQEIISYAKKEVIDLGQAVVPYMEYINDRLQILFA
jgi:glycosyltransferase involved in cell wall biosynthesis